MHLFQSFPLKPLQWHIHYHISYYNHNIYIHPGSKATSTWYRPIWYDIGSLISRWYRQTLYRPISSDLIWYRYRNTISFRCHHGMSVRHRHYDIITIWIYNQKRISVISDCNIIPISLGPILVSDIGMISSVRDVEWVISGLTIPADMRFDDIILISDCRYHIMSADIGVMSPCYLGI